MNQIIVLIIFMTASALSIYSQDVKKPEQTTSAPITSEPAKEDLNQDRAKSPAEAANSGQVAAKPESPSESYIFPTKRERFDRYVSNTVGPISLLRVGIAAGIGQWRDSPEEWGQGASGYGKRFASQFGKRVIKQTIVYGLDEALDVDTRFERSKRKGFFPRLRHALAENVTSRTRTGKRVISIPQLAGMYGSGVIAAETWYPSRYNYKDGLRSGTNSLITGFGINLVREFIIPW